MFVADAWEYSNMAYQYDVKSGTATDAWQVIALKFVGSGLIVSCKTNNLLLIMANRAGDENDEIEIIADDPAITYPFSAEEVQVKNKTDGNDSEYQIINMR